MKNLRYLVITFCLTFVLSNVQLNGQVADSTLTNTVVFIQNSTSLADQASVFSTFNQYERPIWDKLTEEGEILGYGHLTHYWGDEFNHYELDSTLWTFDLGTGAPTYLEYESSSTNFIPSMFPKDSFSVRWEGSIKSDYTGEHTFYTVADDGVKLYVDDELLIDNWELGH